MTDFFNYLPSKRLNPRHHELPDEAIADMLDACLCNPRDEWCNHSWRRIVLGVKLFQFMSDAN